MIKKIFFAILLLAIASPAWAVTNTWIGTTSTYSTATNWDQGHKPAAGEDVVINNTAALSLDENTADLNSWDMTGYTGTWSGSGNLTVVGSSSSTVVCLLAGTNNTWGGTLKLNPATSTTDINFTNGGMTTIYGISVTASADTGDVFVLDSISLSSTKSLTLARGRLHLDGAADVSGLSHSVGTLATSGSGVKTLNYGNCTIDCTRDGSLEVAKALSIGGTNLTSICGGSTVIISGAGTTTYDIQAGGKTYNVLKITGPGTQTINDTGLVCATLWYQPSTTALGDLLLESNITVSGELKLIGGAEPNRVFIRSDTLYTQRTITMSGSPTVISNCAYVDFQDIAFVSASNLDFSGITGGSGNVAGNSISGGGTLAFTAADTETWNNVNGGSYSTAANWTGGSVSRVPLAQDTAVLGIAYGTSKTVTFDVRRTAPFSFAGATWTTSLTLSVTAGSGQQGWATLGNVILEPGMTFSSNSYKNWGLSNRARTGSVSINLGGSWYSTGGSGVSTSFQGSTAVFGRSFGQSNGSSGMSLGAGTHDFSSYNVDVSAYKITIGSTSVVQMGNGTWTDATGAWTCDSGATLTCNGSTVQMNAQSTFAGGGKIYNIVRTPAGSTGVTVTGANTIGTLILPAGGKLKLPSATTTTITNGFIATGTSGSHITIVASTGSSAAVLSKTSGIVTCDWLDITDSTAQGGASWYAGANSTLTRTSGWVNTGAPSTFNAMLLAGD
jgi:hypothetical protein